MMNQDLYIEWTKLLIIPGMLLGFTVHELGHSLAAYLLGDYSQVEHGNITLNPFKHMSTFGAIAFLITGWLGWPKTLQVDPNRLRGKYLGLFIVAMSGPLASLTLTLAGFLAMLITVATLVYGSGATTNEVLALFTPLHATAQETFNFMGMVASLTMYIFISSLVITCVSLFVPLPGFDGFTAIFALVIFFKERWATQQAEAALLVPQVKSSKTINSQQRRNNITEAHFKVGTEFHEAQQYDDAIARYRQALRSDNHFGPAYINLGLAYLAKGRRREAIQAFRNSIQFSDDQPSVLEAVQQLQALSEVSPTDQEKATLGMQALGAEPWTDTMPRPDWLAFGLSIVVSLILALALYGYGLLQVISKLKS
jgi:hypothetical protein